MDLKDLQRSSAEVVLLSLLEAHPRHGYELAKMVETQSGERLQYQVASIYPMLYRLERKGLLAEDWGLSETGREAKYYSLTSAGRAHLRAERKRWTRFSSAVSRALATATS